MTYTTADQHTCLDDRLPSMNPEFERTPDCNACLWDQDFGGHDLLSDGLDSDPNDLDTDGPGY